MSSEANQLKQDTPATDPSQVLAGFSELWAAFSSLDIFDQYQVDNPEKDFISLSYNDVSLFFLSKRTWSDREAVRPFLDNLAKPEFCVILTGEEQDFENLESHLNSEYIQLLPLPSSVRQVDHFVKNLFNMQCRINVSETNRSLVEDTSESVKYVLRVSRELNGIRDTDKLLSLILMKAREITNADAGSVYVVQLDERDAEKGTIYFKVTQNETVSQNLTEFEIPINSGTIVGNAIIHQTSINIPDLYKLSTDRSKNPYNAQHDKTWDKQIGYQCRSMVTLPMYDISNRVIGVIQLINRKKKGVKNLPRESDFESKVIPFDDHTVEYAEIVSHQAGIALENSLLTEERKNLFEGFVHASVTAIEQRDPTTSGHSHRVAKLTTELAKIINRVNTGPYAGTVFSDDQLKEIEFASLLHDFGKLGVREEVLVKAKKLYPWEREMLMERFDHARTLMHMEYYHELVKYMEAPNTFPPGFGRGALQAIRDKKINELAEYMDFVIKSNEPTVLEQGGFERLKDIANTTYTNSSNKTKPLIRDSELKALSVSRGSLTREEFAEIQSHVVHTYEFLRKIPWGTKFSNVPQIAAKHHEKLDGSGYPTSAEGEEIPIQSRMMTISDIFDALTAADRPYKKAVPLDKALDIINMEVKAGKIDTDLFDIFTESRVFKSVLDRS